MIFKRKSNIIVLSIFLLLSCLILLPQYFVTQPNLIDDGGDFQEVANNDFFQLVQNQMHYSRFRLGFIFLRKICYLLFGLQIPYYFLFSGLILGFTVYLLYLTLQKLNLAKLPSFLFSLFFLAFPSITANYYRLGTDEPLLTLLLISAVYAFLTQKYLFNLFLLGLIFLTKETAIFFVLPFLLSYLLNKKYQYFFGLLLIYIIYFAKIIYPLTLSGAGYLKVNQIDLPKILSLFTYAYHTFPFSFLMAAIILVWPFINYHRSRTNPLPIFLLLAAFPQFFLWRSGSPYYHLTLNLLTLLALGQLTKFKSSWIILTLFAAVLGIFCLKESYLQARDWHEQYVYNGVLVKYLLTNDFSKTHVYSTVNHFEMNDKVYIYTTHFGKDRVNFKPLMEEWGNPEQIKQDFINDQFSPKILISPEKLTFNEITPQELSLCAESFFVQKHCWYYLYQL